MQQRPSSSGWSVALAALLLLSAALLQADQAAGSTSLCDLSTQVACRNHPSICIDLESVQDGVADCPDASDEDCQPWEFTCVCGQPRCISKSLVGNGVLDCADGSDEGLIAGNCKNDEDLQNIDDLVRFRRASSDVRVEVNGGQTTTFFLKTDVPPSRPRPLGVITSTKGAFVNEGTTTEYTTQIVGTSLQGTYAKIQSTKSRVFSLVPTDTLDLPADLLPTGLISSSLVTRIRGETTTIETTEFVRTFIDQAYVQEILTSSEIFAPLRPIDEQSVKVQPSPVHHIVIPTVVIDSSLTNEDEDSGKIVFKTSHLTSIVGERVIQPSIVSADSHPSDDDKPTEDETKKIISSFEEVPDNNLRGSRARSNLAEPVNQSKSAVVLETFVADSPVRKAESAVTVDRIVEANEAAVTESAIQDQQDVVDTTTAESPSADELVEPTPAKAPVVVEAVPESELSVSQQLDQITAVNDNEEVVPETADELTTESLDFLEETLDSTDAPEAATHSPQLFNDEVEPSSQDGQREPRVETRPTTASPILPVAATLQIRPAEPIRPIGLITSFEGSLVNDGTTTVYTSQVFGTVIDGEWANVVSTVTRVITPTPAVVTVDATAPVAVIATPLPADPSPVPKSPEVESSISPQTIEASAPVTATPQGLLPVTRVTTFTFFTTFTETIDVDQVVTSVSSREVVSSEVQFVEETIKPDDIIGMMLGEPGNETNPSVTTIFKTYTYFSTIFDDLTTKMITREEVESTVITLTEAPKSTSTTPPAIEATSTVPVAVSSSAVDAAAEILPSVIESSLMETTSGSDVTSKKKLLFNSLASGIVKTFFTTFTFFTTALVNGTTVVSSRIVVSSKAVTPTVQLTDIDEELWKSLQAQDAERSSSLSSSSSISATTEPVAPPSIDVAAVTKSAVIISSTAQPPIPEPVSVSEISIPEVTEVSEESTSATDSVSTTSSTSSTTEAAPTVSSTEAPVETTSAAPSEAPTDAVSEDPIVIVSEEPVVSEEPPTIEPSTATEPSLPQTIFTTFTYFTTFFTEGTSNIVSREETVTNVLTETDAVVEATVPSVFPITYYTTFTYRTTSISEGETIVSTREETVTNIVTPTVDGSADPSVALSIEATPVPIAITPTPTIDPALTTFYTTFTYFATTFDADTAIVTSSLETITNIVSASETITAPAAKPTTATPEIEATPPQGAADTSDNTARNIGNSGGASQLLLDLSDNGGKTSLPQPTGLISTIRSTRINNGITTVFTTDVLGTFINGQYARILESSSEVVNPGDRVPATVIVAASGVEGLEATDLFPPASGPVELEGSIVQPVGSSSSVASGDSSSESVGSKVDGARITTRLSAPARNRTFVPAIRPFTQRPRPPLPTRPRRPPFTSAKSNDGVSSASAVSPSAASTSASAVASSGGSSSSSSSARPFSSRFRPSATSASASAVSASTTESSSRNQFFRLRSSAASSINPTPVVSGSSSLPGRRFSGSSSSASPTVASAASRSSLGPLAARRPSILSSGVRSSGVTSSSVISSAVASSTPRFGRPSTAAPITVDDDDQPTTDANTEASTPPTARLASSFRRPSPFRSSSAAAAATETPATTPAAPAVPSRRQFPFSRSTSRPTVQSAEPARASPASDSSSSSSSPSSSSSDGATNRPRFVRPPKLTFTEKPRPAIRLPTRPSSRGSADSSAASNIDEVTVEAPAVANERSKRQIDFDYYFYDPVHYRRPSRSKTSRSRGRATSTSSSRFVESDYDYDQRISQLSGADYDGFDYDEPKVSRARQTVSSTSSSAALRERLRAQSQSRSQATTPAPRTRSRTSSSSSRQGTVSRTRKPSPEEVLGTGRSRGSTTSSSSRNRSQDSASRQRARPSSAPTTTERATGANARRFGNGRRPSGNRNRVNNDFAEEDAFISPEPVLPSSAPPLTLPLTVTHRVPVETTIPVVNNGRTEFRTVMAAKPSVEILEQYSTLRVGGAWRYIASEVSATPAPGTTLITQFVLKPSETTTVTFTPTTIRGRPTSFSHVVPSTAFEVDPVVSTLTDPVVSTNSLLQQLLLGGLQQANGVPVTSFVTHTSTFVTTLTEFRSTKIPITLRGQEIFTTIVGTSTSVITATEFSTETIVNEPTELPQGNPLASLLPALLGNQLLQAQLLAPQLQPAQVLPILPTQAPQAAIALPVQKAIVAAPTQEPAANRFTDFFEPELHHLEPVEEIVEEVAPPVVHTPAIAPAKPIPATSVITLFLSGRRPGEFSSILSTITLDGANGADATVVKRQISPSDVLPMESSELPFMVGTDKGIYELPENYSPQDLDYYVMSAINEVDDAEPIVDVGETRRLADIVKKATKKSGAAVRKARSADDELHQLEGAEEEFLEVEEDPLEAVESQVDLVRVEPPAGGRGALRRKTVTVTRKVSEPVRSDRKVGEDFVANPANRGRKVVVVTRRRPVSTTNIVAAEQPIARRIDGDAEIDSEGKPFVVIRKRPVNRDEESTTDQPEAPTITSSKVEPESPESDPLFKSNSLFGDIYAPRTYYTIYSYFYTLLNGPSSGQVSTREVSISEIVRGSDGRIPSGFQRTENGNGLYPLSSGRSVADLSTRVNNGITTQVNLASMTMVKYGRGAVRANSIGVKPKEEDNVVRQTVQQQQQQPRRRVKIVPSPRVEPSFDDLLAEDEVTIAPTQKLPSVTRTRGRATEVVRSTSVVRQPAAEEAVATATESRASGANRGRGTVRFNPATVLGESLDVPLATLSRSRASAQEQRVPQRVPQRAPTPPLARGASRGTVRGTAVRGSVARDPIVQDVRVPSGRGRRPVVHEQDIFHEQTEEPFVEDEFFADHHNEFHDPPLEEDYLDEPVDEELSPLVDGHEEEYDYFVDTDPAQIQDVNAVDTPTPAVKTSAQTPTIAGSVSISASGVSSTKLVGVTPTRTTISRKLLNPLQSHLSSILANSRSGLKSSSSVQKTNEPGSSVPFRSRASKSSILPTFTTSTVVLKQFQTLSTLAVDGGRSGIPLTLITSTLTTLFDSELSLLTESPDVFKAVAQPTQLPVSRPKPLNLKPTARLSLPIRASVAIGLSPSAGVVVESTIEDTATESTTDTTEIPSISELLLRGGNLVTVVETQLRTFTAVVTRKSGTEEEVTTRLEVLPELVTKTVVQIDPTPAVDVQASLDALENLVPTARAIPSRDGREQLVGDEDIEELRGARLNVGGNPNFATRVMSNGVEVIVASEKKPTLLAQNVIQKSQTVIEPSPPITLAASTLVNQVTMAGEVDNVRLFSSIQSDPARFQTLTQMTTFTYLTTLLDGASKVVSSREEVITNFVTQEKGRRQTFVQPTATVTTGVPGASNYNTFTQMTTYTYFNTFLDLKRPVVLTSKETVSNVVTVPAGQPEPTERSFETSTYLRTYIFSSKLDRDAIATSKEVVTQVVITEAPRVAVQPTPVVTFSEVTKTYLNTFTLLSTQVEGTRSTVHRVTTVRPEVVVETIRDFEPTPVLEGSKVLPTEDDFAGDGPLVATKTYFTTKTHFTTLQQGTKTIVQSRKEVQSSVVTETIDGLSASLFAQPAPVTKTPSGDQKVRPTYVQLGPNLYGKLRTLFATATYFITNSAGQVTSKRLVVPQVTTETVPLDSIPSEALIEPSIPSLTVIETTPVPTPGQILTAEQLQALKQSFLAGQQTSANLQPSLILSPEQLTSLKESFLANKPVSSVPGDNGETSTDSDLVESTDPTIGLGDFDPPEIGLTPPDGATVIMVTNTAGEVLIIPTEILNVQPTSTSSSSSSSSSSGGISGGVEQQQQQQSEGRRPPNFIPLRPNAGQQQPLLPLQPNQPQRPPTVLRRPEPGVPLQPGIPGSPLLRPGTSSGQQFGIGQPQPTPIHFSPPPLQTGFTGMPNSPKSAVPAARPSASAVPAGVRPPPPPFVNGQNNIDRVQINPSSPVQTIRAPNGQFFAANGLPINVPALPVGSAIPPPPASPPPPPPGPVAQPPVDVIRPGAIVPGPDGKPVRIVGVPEGQEPPPGAEGQVFIRPVPVNPAVAAPVGPAVQAGQAGVRTEQQPSAPATGVRPQSFTVPAVQTIASVVGDNKIVATNIIAGGQTIVVQPNDPTPVFNIPSSTVRPFSVSPAIRPSAVEEGVVVPSELPETGGLEGVGVILQPGLAPSASSGLQPAVDISSTVTPSHEFAFGSESGEVDHTPTLNIFSDSPSTEILPSVFQNAPTESATTSSSSKWPVVHHDLNADRQEPFGITSVVMGPDGQDFTTVVSRVETDGRTAFSTIVQQSTTVNYVEPTTVQTTFATTPMIEEVKTPEPVLTFPPDSPFVPPTNRPQAISSSSSSTSTTRSRPPTTTPAAEVEPPMTKDVIEDNLGNKVVLGGGFGGSFGVNQPSTFQDGCRGRCDKEKQEICVYANGQHDCLCRPGFSRSHSSEVCTKTYTYQLKLVLESVNRTMLHFDNNLKDEISPQYRSLASSARQGLKQALMRTDLSEAIQDSHVMGIYPTSESELQSDGILVDFFVHLKKQQDEDELKNKLMKSLEGNNYLLGDSDIVASRFTDSLSAQDFDECSHEGHHDCSEFADCINEKGSYRCVCRPGFVDSSDEDGRICLAERQDCEECNGHGRCVFEPATNDMTCICNKWFAGSECQINLKVVMIVVLAVGIFVILLITAIIVVCCLRSRRAKGSITGGPSFLRYRGPSVPASGTLDRAAMIRGDTSSEGSGNDNFAAGSNTLEGKSRAAATGPALQSYRPYGEGLMIPRAKHQHGPTTSSSGANPGAAERGEAAPNREHQLMDYLDGRGPKKVLPDRDGKMQDARSSEALSAGGRTSVSSTSQFRDSLGNADSAAKDTQEKPESSVLDMTVSEVRSFDETTIHPATRRPAQYYQSDDSDNSNFDSL